MKSLISIAKKLKQILTDSNIALVDKGLNIANSLSGVADELDKIEINRLPYLFRNEIIELNESDFGDGQEIVSRAFYGCTSLKSVTIPDGVTKISEEAFIGCPSLESVTIPNSVDTIEIYIFRNPVNQLTNVKNIYLYSIIPPSLASKDSFPTNNVTIHVPKGSGNAYKSATNWSYHSARIVEDIIFK